MVNLTNYRLGKLVRPLYLSCIILVACFIIPEKGFAKRPSENTVIRKELPNGMVIILQENHSAPVVSIQVFVKAGSVQETDAEAGIAHVHEHMLFKGTTTRDVGEIAKTVEAAGGAINAYTSWQRTVYYIDMASRFKETGIDIMADIIQNAKFDPDELKKELEVVLEEFRRGQDIPAKRLSKAFFAKAYTQHLYKRPVIGFENTISNFTREDVLRFYRKWYVPENMVWVMVGDFNAKTVLPDLEERLSKFKQQKIPTQPRIIEPPQTAPRIFIKKEDIKQVHMKLGFHIPELIHPDVPALDILALILGQGKSSRLYQALRMQKRLVNSISAYSMTPKDPGLFIVSASLETKDIEKAYSAILREIFLNAFKTVKEEELKKAKAQIESDFIYQKQTVQNQAGALGNYEVSANDLEFGDKYLSNLQEVRTEDILRVAETYLQPNNLTLGLLVPKSASGIPSKKNMLKKVTRTYKELKSRFSRRKSSVREQGDVMEFRLSNGVRLLIKENHAVPLVAFRAVFLGGLLSETPETNGINHFIASMLTKGTTSRTARQIAQEVESLAGAIAGFSGRDTFGLTGETVAWNFSSVFEIFSDILLHPSFQEGYIEKTRQDILAAIKNKEDNLPRLAFQLFWKNIHPSHPYGLDELGTPETAKSITQNDLKEFYQKRAVAENIVISVVGDIDGIEAKETIEGFMNKLPDEAFLHPVHTRKDPPPTETIREISPDKEQAHIILGTKGACHTDPDKYSLDVLDAILSGQGGRLFIHLRDEESLAYTVYSYNRLAVEPGIFAIYMATQPEKTKDAIKKIREQLKRIQEEAVPQKELDRAKNYLIGTYEIGLQTNGAQAAALAFNERYGLGYQEYKHYPTRINAVTAKQVRKVAEKYLCPDCLIETIVRPKNK